MLENEFLEGVSKMREASRAMGSPAQASLSLSNPASEANTPLQTKIVLKKPLKLICFQGFYWCATRDLNPHGLPLEPKSSASANSATPAKI